MERQAAYFEAGETHDMRDEGLMEELQQQAEAGEEEGATKAILPYSSMFFLTSENPWVGHSERCFHITCYVCYSLTHPLTFLRYFVDRSIVGIIFKSPKWIAQMKISSVLPFNHFKSYSSFIDKYCSHRPNVDFLARGVNLIVEFFGTPSICASRNFF